MSTDGNGTISLTAKSGTLTGGRVDEAGGTGLVSLEGTAGDVTVNAAVSGGGEHQGEHWPEHQFDGERDHER